MKIKRIVLGLVAASALVGLGACDRVAALGDLAGDALAQITAGSPAPDEAAQPSESDLLAAASLDDRALFGPMAAPMDLQPINLDEMLQTQSFFAVGSVIAMPKAQFTEPVLEPETFALTADEPVASAPADAATMNTDSAPAPDSAALPAGPSCGRTAASAEHSRVLSVQFGLGTARRPDRRSLGRQWRDEPHERWRVVSEAP